MSESILTVDGLVEFGWCMGCGKPFSESVEEAHMENHRMMGTEDEHPELLEPSQCPRCEGSGHDPVFCPATAWAEEGTLKPGDPDGRCHPCPDCDGTGIATDLRRKP